VAVLLPEKTVEIWTGIAVSRFLPSATIWSPPNYRGSVDQWIRAGKTWAFELKTAYEGKPSYVPIDLYQLRGHAYDPPHGIPVLYVLPAVQWSTQPAEPMPMEAASWATYPWWAWVVSARQLAGRLNVKASGSTTGEQRIPVSDLPLSHVANTYWNTGMWLAHFLVSIGACREPRNWALRLTENQSARVRTPADDDGTDAESHRLVIHVPISDLPGM
jgi:hypothetical protein